jgi:hypothetical protein
MTDLSKFIEAKSDQMNADDLLAGPRTVVVREVRETGSKDQPIAILFDGDNGKPYKPGKSMRRVLVYVWGEQGRDYVGRAMTLYRDGAVSFGGQEVGGIRISHMSHIDREVTLPLKVTRANTKPFVVKPLKIQQQQQPEMTIDDARDAINDASDLPTLERVWKARDMAPFREALAPVLEARKTALSPAPQGASEDVI